MAIDPQPKQKSSLIPTSSQEGAGAGAGSAMPPPGLTPSTRNDPGNTAAEPNHAPEGLSDESATPTQPATSDNRVLGQSSELAINPTSSSTMPPPTSSLNPQSAAILTKISALESQLTTLRAELSSTQTQLNAKIKSNSQSHSSSSSHPLAATSSHHFSQLDPSTETSALASSMVARHIKLLHEYNNIKDVGLGLMGLIADGRGCRLAAIMEELGVGGKD